MFKVAIIENKADVFSDINPLPSTESDILHKAEFMELYIAKDTAVAWITQNYMSSSRIDYHRSSRIDLT